MRTKKQPRLKDGWTLYRFSSTERMRQAMYLDVKRVARIFERGNDEGPSLTDYKREGNFKPSAVCRVFGHQTSWFRSLTAMNLTPPESTRKRNRALTFLDVKIAVDTVRKRMELPIGVAPPYHKYEKWAQELKLPSARTVTRISDPKGGTSWIRGMRKMCFIPREETTK